MSPGSEKVLPADWREVTAGDCLTFHYGKGLPARKRRPGTVGVYASAGRVGEHDESLTDEQCVVIGRKGAAGRISVTEGPSWTIDTAYYVVPPSYLELRFLAYQLEAAELDQLDQSTAIPSLSRDDLNSLRIVVPPREEQSRIVQVIDDLIARVDDGLGTLDQVEGQIERFRAAVLAAAVTGSLVGASDSSGDAQQLLEQVLNEREKASNGKGAPAAPSPTPGVVLPAGWTWATVDQLSTSVQYGSSAKTSDDSSGVPVLRMGNIVDGQLDLASLKFLPREHEEFPGLLLSPGDLLFNRTNSAELVGKAAVYRGEPEPCSFASYLIRVRTSSSYMPELLSYFLASALGRSWVASVVTQQVGQANVNGTKLKQLTVPLPPADAQAKVVATAEAQLHLVADMRQSLAAAREESVALRRAILREAFRGRLTGGRSGERSVREVIHA